MLPQEIIRHKRDKHPLSSDQIHDFITGVTDNTVTDAQIAAFCMAGLLNGFSVDERVNLTLSMRDSGAVLNWDDLDRPVVDKHSTGGVGDKVSLILAPVIAAAGGAVPMLSGRGLGHTGGTLDKMESIPGYNALPGLDKLRYVTRDVGCAIVGATGDIAPADKRIYGVRDTTGTVESIDLITASILSKKMAAGLSGLVMDVKIGNGAFMNNMTDANNLANALVTVACDAGLPTIARITDMNQVLGDSAGNAVEVAESINFLTATHRDPRLLTVIKTLCAEMLVLVGLANDLEQGKTRVMDILDNGQAAEKFGQMVVALSGPSDILDNYNDHLPVAPVIKPVIADKNGVITTQATRDIGLIVVEMGGGRTDPAQDIDPCVGITDIRSIGTPVKQGDEIARIHARNDDMADMAIQRYQSAITIGPPDKIDPPVIHDRISN